ncbi:MAG: potassium channel family protein [Planctomycetales bacterium]|nr:potassium channel family protein [Planctomycetales bacterium]
MTLKQRVYEVLETAQPGDRLSRRVDIALVVLIGLNVAAAVLESVEEIHSLAPRLFAAVEQVSVVLFSLEYLARLWSCTSSPRFASPVMGRVRFATSLFALVDLLAIAPFYLGLLPGVSLALDLRMLRALRLLRLLKLSRYSQALQTFGRVFYRKRQQLTAAIIFLVLLLLFASTLMYYAERDAQPKSFASIPAAMWWAVSTLTTVGYGDVYPITPLGKLLAALVAVLGIGMFALPTSILGAGFVEALDEKSPPPPADNTCPHCGKSLGE